MKLVNHISGTQVVDGFTLTGGDPLVQSEALAQLLPKLSEITDDILVYTGFDFDTVKKQYPELVSKIGVLIDGKYIESRNTGIPLRGSDNQNIIVLKEQLQTKYRDYLDAAQNEIQNFTTLDGVISVGIHRPGYDMQVDALLRQKGLENI
jgi:anaerobic ribonucleoside-triphosphate reductase activating protein